MLDRIKWAEESRSKDADIESKCQLVWEGIVSERNFSEVSKIISFLLNYNNYS